jgi:pimeloyl-ACP methyl ester carboxylesterase
MPQPKPTKNPLKHLRASDARAIAQLATQATTGVVNIAEGVHQSVWQTLGLKGGQAPGQTGGLTGLVYQSVRGVTQLVGKSFDALLARLQPVLDAADHAAPGTPQREAVLAALNGVLGDRLAESHSPLATRMTVRHGAAALNWQALPADLPITGKVLVLIHGLCMNDLQWQTGSKAPRVADAGDADDAGQSINHGNALALALGYTPVYVRYNTGLHTSQNGAELSNLLEQLVVHWPTPIEELTVVAHSMGGLVTRSAVQQATHRAMHPADEPGNPGKSGTVDTPALRWPTLLKNIVFLGTPHHGAPLERAGNWVDVILGSTRYSKPFARLAQLRSAGITDLRYGHVARADWEGHDRFRKKPDSRLHVPLPEGVACFAVAATTAATATTTTAAGTAGVDADADASPVASAATRSSSTLVLERLVGDGLVPVNSALGVHDDPRRCLAFAKKSLLIAHRTNHMQLLSSPLVARQMVAWLAPKALRG